MKSLDCRDLHRFRLFTNNRLYKKYIRNISPMKITNYQKFRNKYNHLIRTVKKKYFTSKLDEASNNIKSTWGVINQLLIWKRPQPLFHLTLLIKIFYTQTHWIWHVLMAFNNYFVNIGSVLSDRISPIAGSPSEFLKGCYPPLHSFNPSAEKEIIGIIPNMRDSVAGHYKIRSCLIIKRSSSIIKPLTYIFTTSLETGIIPNELEVGKVVPETGDWSSLKN